MSGEVTLRDFEDGDEEQVFSLMEEIYDPAVVANSRKHWDWEFRHNPRNVDGRIPIRVVARDDQIVAMICGIRQDFYLRGTVSSGLWVVDFMARQAGTTQKDRLRYGQRLAFELRDHQPLVAGVNRPALNRYWKRVLGDQVDICAVPMMIRPLRAGRLARRRLGNPALAAAAGVAAQAALPLWFRRHRREAPEGAAFARIERFDDRFDRFWERAASTFSHLSVRDATFLNWRYLDVPDREYTCFAAVRGEEILGWIVVRVVRDGELMKGRIVDMLAAREDVTVWHYLISQAVSHLSARGADLVHGLGSTVEAQMRAYRECGFRPNPEHARSSQYIAYNNLDGIDQDAFYDGDNWYVTLGDSDTDFASPE